MSETRPPIHGTGDVETIELEGRGTLKLWEWREKDNSDDYRRIPGWYYEFDSETTPDHNPWAGGPHLTARLATAAAEIGNHFEPWVIQAPMLNRKAWVYIYQLVTKEGCKQRYDWEGAEHGLLRGCRGGTFDSAGEAYNDAEKMAISVYEAEAAVGGAMPVTATQLATGADDPVEGLEKAIGDWRKHLAVLERLTRITQTGAIGHRSDIFTINIEARTANHGNLIHTMPVDGDLAPALREAVARQVDRRRGRLRAAIDGLHGILGS